ncbi:protein LURP-one-related 5-like [Zingiber officinale]|nr:protein LURP-one-related 5-like [Zingiber officinale]
MSRIHPTVVSRSNIEEEEQQQQLPTSTGASVWTVWKKSSMAFHGTDGFSIYDGKGKLAFRVENYSRKHKCFAGELLLMDGAGKAIMALKPQILSMHDRWTGFRFEDGTETSSSKSHVFSMRRRSILQGCDEAEVFMETAKGGPAVPDFRTEGCFRRRNCKILDEDGREVASMARKKANKSITLGDDVFSLVVQPNTDVELVMAFVVIMDRIC